MNKKQILHDHPFTIYQQSDGRWRTYVKQEDGKRKILVKKDRTDLEAALVAFYVKVEEESHLSCEWLFPDGNGGHIHKNPIRDCFRNRCKMVGITKKGTHALRRTLNSELRISGVSSVMAASLIGNSTFVNDKHYTFDVSNLAEKEKIIEKANKKLLEKASLK